MRLLRRVRHDGLLQTGNVYHFREHPKNKIYLDRDVSAVLFFSTNRINLGSEDQTGGDAHREQGRLRTRGKFTGKWIAEGKGKRGDPEYPDRELALRAERVLARS